MFKIKANSLTVKVFGYLTFGLGCLDFVVDHVVRFFSHSYWQSYAPAQSIGDSALILAGVIALLVGDCLKNFEQRLSKLEKDKAAQASD